MADAPSPARIRNPGPATDRIPQPSSIVIRPPGVMVNMGHPDITVRGLIGPITVSGEFRFIFIKLGGEIRFLNGPIVKNISRIVPLGKTVAVTGIQIFWARTKSAVGGHQSFFRLHKNRSLSARGFDRSFHNMNLCFAVFHNFNSVKSLFENVKRGIRCMNFKILLST
jgi:hypothetical protein